MEIFGYWQSAFRVCLRGSAFKTHEFYNYEHTTLNPEQDQVPTVNN
jgi:hypothetical protein